MTDVAQVSNTSPTAGAPAAAAQDPAHLWKDKSFGFHDLLDIINPLQHIPLVATVYRYLTGDTIGNVARVAGDALYGGPIGLASGVISAGVQIETGKDIGDHVVALFSGSGDKPTDPSQVMTASAPAAAPATAAQAAAAGTPVKVASAAQAAVPASLGGIPLIRPASPQSSDPREAFIARAQQMRAQSGGGGANTTLNNRVVPLEGPAAAIAANTNRRVIATPFTAAPAGATPRTILQTGGSNGSSADPAAPPAIPASVRTPDGPAPAQAATATPTAAQAGSPPINVSQQMLDALDKYMRMQQQKSADQGRGNQVDTVH